MSTDRIAVVESDGRARRHIELEPGSDGLCKTDCGKLRMFCGFFPESQMRGYKDQLREGGATNDPYQARPTLEMASPCSSIQVEGPMPNASSHDHPLVLSLRLKLGGRGVDKPLKDLEDAAKKGRAKDLESLLPDIVAKYCDYFCPLELAHFSLQVKESHKELPLQYGKNIENGLIESYSVCEYPDRDLVSALAAYLEVESTAKFYEELVFAKKVDWGERNDTSSVWHIATRNKGPTEDICEDNVYRYKVVDALDQQSRSVVLVVWTMTGELPAETAPAAGFMRGFECSFYRFLPLWNTETNRYMGFRLARAKIIRPSPGLYTLFAGINEENLIESARMANENFRLKFDDHLQSSELEQVMKSSPRAGFYRRMQARLQAPVPKKATATQRLGKLCRCCS